MDGRGLRKPPTRCFVFVCWFVLVGQWCVGHGDAIAYECQLLMFMNWSAAGFVPDLAANDEGACYLLLVILWTIDALVLLGLLVILHCFTFVFAASSFVLVPEMSEMSAYRYKYCTRFLTRYTYINEFCM